MSLFLVLLTVVLWCRPAFAESVADAEKANGQALIGQYKEQLKSYQRLKMEFDRHPVTRWEGEIAGNKKALAVLDKQLRDMIRFENKEEIEQLRQENRELRKKIDTKKKEWEALSDRVEVARKRLESLEKQIGPAAQKE
ncbi:MAG: hypothetical protein ACYSTQ_06655 [Planctomycetota bacterium]